MALAIRGACDKKVVGNSNKGNGNKSSGRAMARRGMKTMWVMESGMRLAGNKEDKCKGSKGNGNSVVRVAGKEEDGGEVNCDGNKGGRQW
jgi:hypothetical protein